MGIVYDLKFPQLARMLHPCLVINYISTELSSALVLGLCRATYLCSRGSATTL
jgi:hypothetical protein